MRMLFLDFDGVLHPLGLIPAEGETVNGKPRVKPVPVEFFCWVPLLAEILADHPDVGLASHTSWRDSHSGEALGAYLGDLQARHKGATCAGDKLASIQAWLAIHPEVTDYLILDDVPMGGPDEVPELLLCHYQKGVSCPEVQRELRAWLKATKPADKR